MYTVMRLSLNCSKNGFARPGYQGSAQAHSLLALRLETGCRSECDARGPLSDPWGNDPGSPRVRRDRRTADLRGDLKQDVFREVVDGEEVFRSMQV
jgi:hypothetical protein